MDKQEAIQIKQQLLMQLESSHAENKEEIIEAVKEMSAEELENFLKQNKIQYKISNKEKKEEECVFCSILEGKIPSYKIDENKNALAILEINPLSPGHSIIISRKHDKIANSSFSLANMIARRIKSKLHSEETKIENSRILGHEIINVIPAYKNQKLERRKASEKELVLLQEKLKKKERRKREKKEKKGKKENIPEAPRRIP